RLTQGAAPAMERGAGGAHHAVMLRMLRPAGSKCQLVGRAERELATAQETARPGLLCRFQPGRTLTDRLRRPAPRATPGLVRVVGAGGCGFRPRPHGARSGLRMRVPYVAEITLL